MKLYNPFINRKSTLAGAIADTCLILFVVFIILSSLHYLVNAYSPEAIITTIILVMLGYTVIYYVYYMITGKDPFKK